MEYTSGFSIDNANAIIPGTKKIKIGRSFRYAPKIAPLLPIFILFAANVLWTIYWSVHQYQIPTIVPPIKSPVHGKSGSDIGRHILKWSGLTARTVSCNWFHPPTSWRPRYVIITEPKIRTNVWRVSVYITAFNPPITV